MNLLVDVGNSRMKWTMFDGGNHWMPAQSAEVYRRDLTAVLERCWAGLDTPRSLLVSNVGGDQAGRALRNWAQERWGIEATFFRSVRRTKGVVNDYQRPEQLGPDRWAAVIGARSLRKTGALCVIDCGTAVTVDALSADDHFLGGVIIPGIDLLQESLLARTSEIRESRAEHFGVFGTSTAECVSGGSYVAIAGGITRALADMQAALNEPAHFITGGDAQALLPFLDYPLQYDPDLVLRGLAYTLG